MQIKVIGSHCCPDTLYALNQLAAGLVFGLCFLLNLVNIWQTGQFWPAIQIPRNISRPLWALFLLSGVSTLWSEMTLNTASSKTVA